MEGNADGRTESGRQVVCGVRKLFFLFFEKTFVETPSRFISRIILSSRRLENDSVYV